MTLTIEVKTTRTIVKISEELEIDESEWEQKFETDQLQALEELAQSIRATREKAEKERLENEKREKERREKEEREKLEAEKIAQRQIDLSLPVGSDGEFILSDDDMTQTSESESETEVKSEFEMVSPPKCNIAAKFPVILSPISTPPKKPSPVASPKKAPITSSSPTVPKRNKQKPSIAVCGSGDCKDDSTATSTSPTSSTSESFEELQTINPKTGPGLVPSRTSRGIRGGHLANRGGRGRPKIDKEQKKKLYAQKSRGSRIDENGFEVSKK